MTVVARISVRAFREGKHMPWVATVRVKVQDPGFRHFETRLFYRLEPKETKEAALKEGRRHHRELRKRINDEGRIPHGRLFL